MSGQDDPRRPRQPHVVIVGGGFGGLYAAKALANAPARVTLLDRRNHHVFQPLLYQVATAALSPAQIAAPLRAVLRHQRNTRVLLAEAIAVDAPNKRVLVADGHIPYDHLILATGASHSYFGHPEWEPMAPGLKTLEDAIEIRRRVFSAFEEAELTDDPAALQALLTFVVVGGGPTGVELAGALAEIARHTLASEFRGFDPANARVLLLEGLPRVLPPFPEDLSASAERQLRALGVEVRLGALVTEITPNSVTVGGERIPARTVLWAAGVAASPLARSLGVPLDRSGRVLVEPDLTVPGYPEIAVIGDLAAFTHQTGKPLPGVAPVAIQQGQAVAENVQRAMLGHSQLRFHYRDRGSLATIGRAAGVADLKFAHFTGYLAWLMWLFIHVVYLIGFTNRVLVMLQWAWSYFTFQRGARLITNPRSPESPK